MSGGKISVLNTVFGVVGAAASLIAIVQYFNPPQNVQVEVTKNADVPQAVAQPSAGLKQESRSEAAATPIASPAITGSKSQLAAPVPKPSVVVPAAPSLPPPAPEETEICIPYTDFENKSSFSLTKGMEVCDSSGRLLATVKSVTVDGFPDYIGVVFTRPGQGRSFCWNEAKSCELPFAPGRKFYIERLKKTIDGGVAMMREAT